MVISIHNFRSARFDGDGKWITVGGGRKVFIPDAPYGKHASTMTKEHYHGMVLGHGQNQGVKDSDELRNAVYSRHAELAGTSVDVSKPLGSGEFRSKDGKKSVAVRTPGRGVYEIKVKTEVVDPGTGKILPNHFTEKKTYRSLKQANARAQEIIDAHDKKNSAMAKLTKEQRDALPKSDFGDPENRLFPIIDQDDVDSAARLIGKAHGNKQEVIKNILSLCKKKNLSPPDAWKEQAAMSESTPFEATFTAESVDDGDFVIRTGLCFRSGDYPDKQFTLTPEEALTITSADFQPVPNEIEHFNTEGFSTILDGHLGELRSISVSNDGTEIHGEVAVPKWLDNIWAETGRKVSLVFDRETKKIKRNGLVITPRVTDAAVMSAYVDFAGQRHDTPEGQSTLQQIHDTVARVGAKCAMPNSRPSFHSGHELSGIQKIHDAAVEHGATCRRVRSAEASADYLPRFSTDRHKISVGGKVITIPHSGKDGKPAHEIPYADFHQQVLSHKDNKDLGDGPEIQLATNKEHRLMVDSALDDGKDVPGSVLKDYGDLASIHGATERGARPGSLVSGAPKFAEEGGGWVTIGGKPVHIGGGGGQEEYHFRQAAKHDAAIPAHDKLAHTDAAHATARWAHLDARNAHMDAITNPSHENSTKAVKLTSEAAAASERTGRTKLPSASRGNFQSVHDLVYHDKTAPSNIRSLAYKGTPYAAHSSGRRDNMNWKQQVAAFFRGKNVDDGEIDDLVEEFGEAVGFTEDDDEPIRHYPGVGQASFTADDSRVAALEAELQRLKAESEQTARFAEQQRSKERADMASMFARQMVSEGRAVANQMAAIITLHTALAEDDTKTPKEVTFGVDGQKGSRLDALKAVFSSVPENQVTPYMRRMIPTVEGEAASAMFSRQESNTPGVEKPPSADEKKRMMEMTPAGRAALASMNNGKEN